MNHFNQFQKTKSPFKGKMSPMRAYVPWGVVLDKSLGTRAFPWANNTQEFTLKEHKRLPNKLRG